MGLPCPISDGIVMSSAIMPAWVGVNARQVAESRLGIQVHIDNDANLGALGEHRRGVGQGHANVVFVKVSSGVGAGLILDHQIFRGTHGIAGEIGHLTFDEQGPLCRCGSRGCLEAYAATGPALAMMAEQMPLRPGRPSHRRSGRDRRGDRGRQERQRRRAAGSSRTPACTSAGGWPRSPTCSTPA